MQGGVQGGDGIMKHLVDYDGIRSLLTASLMLLVILKLIELIDVVGLP